MSQVRLGLIGVGNRGSQLLAGCLANDQCRVVALCDAYEPYVTRRRDDVDAQYLATGKVPAMGEPLGEYARYRDFRELLADDNVDAVIVATPDHWHAVQTIAAIRAGKDVFVEKPLTITIEEGRRMVDAHRQSDRVVGVCLNRRGSSVYRDCVELIRGGKIGDVKAAYAQHHSVMAPTGIGNQSPADPPANFDWDLWLGPRPERPYQYNIAPYYFRWWSDYSSQMGNWGVHFMDGIRWLMGETAPLAVTAVGSKTSVSDDRTIPDTMAVLFEMPNGCIIHFDVNEASPGNRVPKRELMLCGTKGSLCINENGYDLIPARPGQMQKWQPAFEPETHEVGGDASFGDLGTKEDTTQNLIDNFINCVQTREQPYCSLEDAHRSTTFAHLANISLKMKQRLEWDPEAERVTNIPEANDHLHYDYRKPWSLD